MDTVIRNVVIALGAIMPIGHVLGFLSPMHVLLIGAPWVFILVLTVLLGIIKLSQLDTFTRITLVGEVSVVLVVIGRLLLG